MARVRLQTQLLISALLIICALTGVILLIVRHTVRAEMDRQVQNSVTASVDAFQSFEKQNQAQMLRTAALLAELPTLKALMTTRHVPTIQDASTPFWDLAKGDLFVLSDPLGEIEALHGTGPAVPAGDLRQDLARSLRQGEDSAWWYIDNRLYWVFIQPISAGVGNDAKMLGTLSIGYQVRSSVAEHLSMVAGGKIVLATGNRIIASTLNGPESDELQRRIRGQSLFGVPGGAEVSLAGDPYRVESVSLHDGPDVPVQCYVLAALRPRLDFIAKLDETIIGLGISAIVLAWILLTFVSRTITRPLDNLVSGVRALASGDFDYSIARRGSSEVIELGEAFSKMRGELMASQSRLIETERVAALGRAASSISHDLRHYLAAVVANAEFLYEAERLKLDPDEIYEEIKVASEQMIELLDSLRELAYEHSAISAVPGSLEQSIERAMDAVLARPELRSRQVNIRTAGDMTGSFDPKKIERAFFNLLLNACEATGAVEILKDHVGKVDINIESDQESFVVRIADNGPGIPDSIRDVLFDPFVSSGKANGTGLGLAIVCKIIHDHGGTVDVLSTSEQGTVFLVEFPRHQHAAEEPAGRSLDALNGNRIRVDRTRDYQ